MTRELIIANAVIDFLSLVAKPFLLFAVPSTLVQPPPLIGDGVKYLIRMMFCVFVQINAINAACIDHYNGVKTHGSEHLQNISFTNGDFVILKNLKLNPLLQYCIRNRRWDMPQCDCLLVHPTDSLEKTQLFFRSSATVSHSGERKTRRLAISKCV